MALTTRTLDEGYFVKAFGATRSLHLAINGRAICGIGKVRQVPSDTRIERCLRCQRVSQAYTEPEAK